MRIMLPTPSRSKGRADPRQVQIALRPRSAPEAADTPLHRLATRMSNSSAVTLKAGRYVVNLRTDTASV